MTQDEISTYSEELTQTVATIFETMMGVELATTGRICPLQADRVVASVQFTGSFGAHLMLAVSREVACWIGGRFLSIDPPETMDDDIRDVLGEIANMIGGNLKSAIAPEASLSIPEVVDGADFKVRICGAAASETVAFQCEAGEFWVSFIQLKHAG